MLDVQSNIFATLSVPQTSFRVVRAFGEAILSLKFLEQISRRRTDGLKGRNFSIAGTIRLAVLLLIILNPAQLFELS